MESVGIYLKIVGSGKKLHDKHVTPTSPSSTESTLLNLFSKFQPSDDEFNVHLFSEVMLFTKNTMWVIGLWKFIIMMMNLR